MSYTAATSLVFPGRQTTLGPAKESDSKPGVGPGSYDVRITNKSLQTCFQSKPKKRSYPLKPSKPKVTKSRFHRATGDYSEMCSPEFAKIGPGYYHSEHKSHEVHVSFPDREAFLLSTKTPRLGEIASTLIPDRFDHIVNDRKSWDSGISLSKTERVLQWAPEGSAYVTCTSEFGRVPGSDESVSHRLRKIHASGPKGATFPLVHAAALEYEHGNAPSMTNTLRKLHKPAPSGRPHLRFGPLQGDRSMLETAGIDPGRYSAAFEANSIRNRTLEGHHGKGFSIFDSKTPRFESGRSERRKKIAKMGSQTERKSKSSDFRSEDEYLAYL